MSKFKAGDIVQRRGTIEPFQIKVEVAGVNSSPRFGPLFTGTVLTQTSSWSIGHRRTDWIEDCFELVKRPSSLFRVRKK